MAPFAAAQEPREPPSIDDLLDRWERLTERERAEKLRLYEERLQDLPDSERRRLITLWEEKLKDLSPDERSDLADRLARVKQRTDLEELRRKQEQLQSIEDRVYAKLPEPSRKRIEYLPRSERDDLRKFCIGRIFWYTRQEMLAALPEPDRETVSRLSPRKWYRTIRGLLRVRDLESMTAADRAEIAALPESERKAAEDRFCERADKARKDHARQRLADEIEELLAMSGAEREYRFAQERGRYLLFRLGILDQATVERFQNLPRRAFRRELKHLETLAAMKPSEFRKKKLDEFLRRIGD